MNDNNVDFKAIIKNNIERNFGGFDIKIDYEKDYYSSYELEIYRRYDNFLYHQGKLGLLLKFLKLFIIFIA